MTIFTKRGGIIVFNGILFLAVGIAMAGYKAIGIFANTFLAQALGDFATDDSIRSMYPSNDAISENGAAAFGQIMGITVMEAFFRAILDKLVTIDNSLIFYFLMIGSMLIFSVVVSFPLFAAGADYKSVKIVRKVEREKVFAGDYLLVEVKVKNKSLNQIPVLEVYDAYPEVFDLALGENFVSTQLASKQSTVFAYILRIPIRGRFLIGPTKVIIHDRQGFFSTEAILAEMTEVLVYPSYEDIKKLQMLGSKRQLGVLFGAHKTKIKGSGTDFFGIRTYQPGDPLKYVHWPSVAKSGGEKMMVREFESEQNIRVIIMIDASASMGAGLPRNTKLEYSIRGAVLMAYLALEKKDSVGLVVFDREMRTFLEPSGNQNFMYQFLENLANITPQGRPDIVKVVEDLIPRMTKASYFVIFSDLEMNRDDILEAMRKLRAHKHRVMIISPFGPWFEARVSELSPTDRMIGEAIQEGFISQRSELFKLLRGLDVLSISVGPDDMLANVMAEFSKMKAIGS